MPFLELQSKFGSGGTHELERRLNSLESRSVGVASSVVTFSAEESSTAPTLGIATLVLERVQVFEAKVNNLEPSLSTLQSYSSSGPTGPPGKIFGNNKILIHPLEFIHQLIKDKIHRSENEWRFWSFRFFWGGANNPKTC